MKKILAVFITLSLFLLTGCEGKSAYDLAVENGFIGTVEDYLESLKGESSPAITIDDLFDSLVNKGVYNESEYELFIQDYLNNKIDSSLQEEVVMNNALMSSVSIVCVNDSTSSAGSGVIYELNKESGDAYIITNYHVIADDSGDISTNINIMIYGSEYSNYLIPVTCLGVAKTYDLAVLKVENSSIIKQSNNLKEVRISTNRVYAGDQAFVVGNALGMGISITNGIVSVTNETISTDIVDSLSVMRIDAAINRGNSGGGVFNKYGLLIGIVDAKTISSGVEGLGYAIPIDTVYSVVENIIRNQSDLKILLLGIEVKASSSVMVYDDVDQKIFIKEVLEIQGVSGVSKGLLLPGDQLIKIEYNNVIKDFEKKSDISNTLLKCELNDIVKITVYRNEVLKTVEITLTNQV